MSYSLIINNLEISVKSLIGYKKIVSDFNLTLHPGRKLGIVGESGSGKTLSMLALNRLLPSQIEVTGGSIFFNNKNLNNMEKKEFYREFSGKKISMIFQEPMTALNPVYTIGKQLRQAFLIHNKGISKKLSEERARSMLDAVKLNRIEERMRQYPHQLSGGQRQRVLIALALINEPEILIADEPTTALDVTVQKEILELINELCLNFKMSLIFISHDLGVISKVSDEIIVMKDGKIIEEGLTKKILKSPKKDYTLGLLKCLWKLEKGNPSLYTDKEVPFIEVKNINKEYQLPNRLFSKRKKLSAVEDVSFSVFKGDSVAIVGESGSGKTTIAKIINGLEYPDSGEILINNCPINKIDLFERARLIQPIFQDPYSTLNPNHTIGYVISRPLIIQKRFSSKEIYQNAIKMLKLVELPATFFYRFPNQLSGGQRQRVSIARALILEPQLLICDEPTSALDVTIQDQILDLLENLKKKLSITIIIISHDISVVKYLSKRILVIKDGKIVESGFTKEVLENPQSSYTKELLSSVFRIFPPKRNFIN
ncbi:MAG: ABC transporter ATP-binding protein [Rhodobacterales bacterium]|nr:MAG: ABC transporter ATP-binding protein [Rhodobacterales bacterium]